MGRCMLSRRELAAGLGMFVANAAHAQTPPVRIYAAMTFRAGLDAVLRAYRDAGGVAVVSYAPTSVLIKQLEGGAAADILITADPDWMDDAAKRGLLRAGSRSNLLANDLVLAGPPGSAGAGEIGSDFALSSLLAGGRLAMCDPERDPAGRYARASLQSLGLWTIAEPHLAIAESSLAAVVLLDRGEVRAAICFATDLRGDDHAAVIGRFPDRSHAPIVYPVALTRDAEVPRASEALAFLRSPQALRIFAGYGYQAPG